MSSITVHFKDKEEGTLIQNLLQKMKISFERDDDDSELTEEMKKVIDDALKQDRSQSVDAFELLKRISEKYGI
ncbi:hypothetical protein ASG01_04250 [Chryseobacterium sp. Leaf180]|jgi:hypothetical protein|uniref:hypothetical protein n=1 Tax=Chryseobacterium sp. Leaf180 TaxID=1736289 RepID=UPI0006F81BFB|nr:hypothetical protein [Chryseobacterium sp. Leaf180]KQR95075.1 hypothetical protein ASG01_04250 [Chryseobacterium sp. Leaf180]